VQTPTQRVSLSPNKLPEPKIDRKLKPVIVENSVNEQEIKRYDMLLPGTVRRGADKWVDFVFDAQLLTARTFSRPSL